jgi:hypothetical protein
VFYAIDLTVERDYAYLIVGCVAVDSSRDSKEESVHLHPEQVRYKTRYILINHDLREEKRLIIDRGI